MFMYDLEYIDFLTWCAVLASFAVYGAGSRTCYYIVMRKSTGDVPLFPFVASLYSGVIWLKYSIMVSSVQYGVANFVNTVLQASYIVIFHSYTKDKRKCLKLLGVAIPLLYGILFYAKYFPKKEVLPRLGYIGCFVTIMMTASPLVTLGDVIKYKSTRTLDFGFISASCAACGLWTISGIMMPDINVALPNGIGMLFGIFQISLFAIYPTSKENKVDSSKDSSSRSDLEASKQIDFQGLVS